VSGNQRKQPGTGMSQHDERRPRVGADGAKGAKQREEVQSCASCGRENRHPPTPADRCTNEVPLRHEPLRQIGDLPAPAHRSVQHPLQTTPYRGQRTIEREREHAGDDQQNQDCQTEICRCGET